MDKRLWNAPDDAEFDQLLASSLPDPPPDEVARAVTPWRRVMEQLVWGLALTGITLQVGGLQYWLPALGTLLCLLAFRALRRENPWLRAGWMVSAVRTGAVWGILILNAFLWRQTPAGQTVMTVLTGAGQLAQLWGLKPYPAEKLMKSAKRFSLSWCRRAVVRCGQTDLAMKSTGQDGQELLTTLLLELANQPAV